MIKYSLTFTFTFFFFLTKNGIALFEKTFDCGTSANNFFYKQILEEGFGILHFTLMEIRRNEISRFGRFSRFLKQILPKILQLLTLHVLNFAKSWNSIKSSKINPLHFNPFFPNASFLYPLKTSKNHKVFWCFQGVEKGCTGNKCVN